MFEKLIVVLLFTITTLAEYPSLTCIFEVIDGKCTCNFLIYNPNGLNNATIRGNPTTDCTSEEVVQAIGDGFTLNIPSSICRELPKLETLKMENVNITNLNGNPFLNCVNLKNLVLSGNEIEEIASYTFSSTKLEVLKLDRNSLKKLDSRAFNNLNNLRELNISYNAGIDLPPSTFEDLRSLVLLSLSNCELEEVDSQWFAANENLFGLDLSDNEISVIKEGTFNSLIQLSWLDLSKNVIATIHPDVFHNNTNIFILDLSDNMLTNLPNLFENQRSLVTLILSKNSFKNISVNLFKSQTALRSLSMSECKIEFINSESFSSMASLDSIDLSYNEIAEIPDDTFAATNKLKNIQLSYNELEILDSKSFGSLRNLEVLNVQNNKIKEVDHHFMNQSENLINVNFENNNCASFKTDNFKDNKIIFMNRMIECFDEFDNKMINIKTFNSTIFSWHNIRTNDGWKGIRVTLTAYENAHIGLTDSLDRDEPLVEIRFGENGNAESQIWEQGEQVFTDNTVNIISETEERTFYVVWRFDVVIIFNEDERFPFMVHSLKNIFPVNFFGLRTLINGRLPRQPASWSVLRIRGNLPLPVEKIHRDIDMKMRLGIPVDLKRYLR